MSRTGGGRRRCCLKVWVDYFLTKFLVRSLCVSWQPISTQRILLVCVGESRSHFTRAFVKCWHYSSSFRRGCCCCVVSSWGVCVYFWRMRWNDEAQLWKIVIYRGVCVYADDNIQTHVQTRWVWIPVHYSQWL